MPAPCTFSISLGKYPSNEVVVNGWSVRKSCLEKLIQRTLALDIFYKLSTCFTVSSLWVNRVFFRRYTDKPFGPCKTIKVVSDEAISLKILCACFNVQHYKAKHSVCITIAYGSSLRVVFENIVSMTSYTLVWFKVLNFFLYCATS